MLDSLLIRFGAEETSSGGISALGLDPKAFIIQLITFLLVFYVIKRYVFGRVVDLLDKRREVIEQGVQLTAEMVVQRDKLDKEVENTMKKARVEANEVLARTQDQASAMIKEAEAAAQAKVDAMVSEAHKKIEDDTQKARRKLEKDLLSLVVEATEIVTEEKIDAGKDAKLLERALKGRA